MQDFKSVVEWGVIGLLLSLSAWAVAVALERWRFYRQVQVQSYRSRVRLETELTQRLGVDECLQITSGARDQYDQSCRIGSRHPVISTWRSPAVISPMVQASMACS